MIKFPECIDFPLASKQCFPFSIVFLYFYYSYDKKIAQLEALVILKHHSINRALISFIDFPSDMNNFDDILAQSFYFLLS